MTEEIVISQVISVPQLAQDHVGWALRINNNKKIFFNREWGKIFLKAIVRIAVV